MTDRERLKLCRRRGATQDFEDTVTTYLPLISTAARALVGEEAVGDISKTVVRSFGCRAHRLPLKTCLAGWFVRTTSYAAQHWLKTNGADQRAGVPANASAVLLALSDLPSHQSDALVVLALHDNDLNAAASTLNQSSRRLGSWIRKGTKRLRKRAGKRGLSVPVEQADSVLSLSFLNSASSSLGTVDVSDCLAEYETRSRPSQIVAQTLRSWSWFHWRRRLKRLAVVAVCFFGLLGSLIGFAAWAYQTGYLFAWLMPLGAKQVLRDAPELALPPREWTGQGLEMDAIGSRAELFGATHVWRVDFRFDEADWKGIKPSRVKPINIVGQDGRMILRNPNAKRSGLAGVLGMEFNWVEAELTFGGQEFTRVAARYRGNGTYLSSLYGSKQSIKIDLNKNLPDQKLFGLDKLNFNNLVEDTTFMHDALGYALFRAAGVAAPRTAYAWMTLSKDGGKTREPRGLFLMLENIDKRFAKDRFGTSKTPIFKPVTPDLFDDLGEDWSAYEAIYDLKTEATEEQLQQVIDFAKSLTHDNDETFAARVETFLDLDQFSRFLASIVLIASYDGFLSNGQNFYLYLDPKTNLFGFLPWDLDHAWGDYPFIGSADERDRASIWHPWAGEHRLLERVMKLDTFREKYRSQLELLLEKEFRLEVLSPRIDAMAGVLDELVNHDNPFRYRRFKEAVGDEWGDPPPKWNQQGVRPVNAIKRYIAARSASVRAQLDGESDGVILPALRMGPPTGE